MDLLEKAQRWAMRGHLGVNRKFSDLPYIVHPEAVAEIISQVTDDNDVIAAAWLHDVVEDTPKTVDDIRENFNDKIANLVDEVSKISKKTDGNREHRVSKDREHYSKASKWGKAIKIADAIHNLPLMIRDNPVFAPTYVEEKKLLLEVIKDGHLLLASILERIILDFEENPLTVFDTYGSIKENKQR